MGDILAQIARIENNIKRSLAKVAAKGVPVPDTATSDDLPDLIESIVGGNEISTSELGKARLGVMRLGNSGTNI